MSNQANRIPGRIRDLELVYKYSGTTRILTSGTSFTTGPLTRRIRYRMTGGGGGGGSADTAAASASCGAGGGASGYAEGWFSVSQNTAYTYAIGAAGAGGTGGAAGSPGGSTTLTVNSVTVTCAGGSGGGVLAAGTALGFSNGGAAGATPTNGDFNVNGYKGGAGIRLSGTVGMSGQGGRSLLGGAGGYNITAGAPGASVGFGQGGGGGLVLNGSAAVDGAAGSPGGIIIDEYT